MKTARDLDFDATYMLDHMPGLTFRIVGLPKEWQPHFAFEEIAGGSYSIEDHSTGEWVENDASNTIIVSPIGPDGKYHEEQFYALVEDLHVVIDNGTSEPVG